MTRRLKLEIVLVLAVTFGTSGLRAALRLVDSLLKAPLNQQSTTIHDEASSIPWLDLALQATSALTLLAWGGLAWFLLEERWRWPRWSDLWRGAGFAALIGLPGLAFYVAAVHLGLSKWSFANGFGEEIVVVMYLVTRLKQLGWKPWQFIAASAVLRGSYHLYQGVSAGFGNIVMGVIFAWYFHKTSRVWPLILAHFFIDAVAFIAYPLLDLSWLGI